MKDLEKKIQEIIGNTEAFKGKGGKELTKEEGMVLRAYMMGWLDGIVTGSTSIREMLEQQP